jgi:hypothetical protein
MSALVVTLVYVVIIGLVWLLPLYFICRWAERQRKDHRIVLLVGFLTGWLIALIVALLLPVLSEEKFAEIGRNARNESSDGPRDATALVMGGLGFCTLILLAFMAWMQWGL